MSLSLVTYSHGVTVGDMIDRTASYLYAPNRTELNFLNGAVTNSATTVTFSDSMNGIRAGATVEVDDEAMYVRSVSSQVATVVRGYNGTTAAAHANGATARVNPRFGHASIIRALRGDIESWPFTVYARYLGELSSTTSQRALDVDGLAGVDGAQLITAQRAPIVGSIDSTWPSIPGARLVRRQAQVEFPSGYSLDFPNYGANQGGVWFGYDDWGLVQSSSSFSVLVKAKAPFDTSVFSSSTDVGRVLGMKFNLTEAAAVGAAARLMLAGDIGRTDSSGMGRSRPADEVHVGDQMNVANALFARRDFFLREASLGFLAEDGMPFRV